MQPTEQLELRPDEETLATALRAALHQRAQAQQLSPLVHARVLAAVAPQRRQSWWRAPAFAAAAAILFTVVAFALLRGRPHPVTEFACMVTTPDHTVRIEWKSPSHVVIQRSTGWKERRLVVIHRNGHDTVATFVAHPATSLWQ